MSDNATFEFVTSTNCNRVAVEVSSRWNGFGYSSDVYVYPDIRDRIFCTLEYFFGAQKERSMLIQVLKYLKDISSDKKIYYYRCDDLAPLINLHIPILEINAEDIFTADFSPCLGASIVTKYALSPESIDRCHTQHV